MCSADESQLIRLLMQLLKAKKVIEIGKIHECVSLCLYKGYQGRQVFVYLQTLPRCLDKSQSKLRYKVQKKKNTNTYNNDNVLETTETAITNRIGANTGQTINNTFDRASLSMANQCGPYLVPQLASCLKVFNLYEEKKTMHNINEGYKLLYQSGLVLGRVVGWVQLVGYQYNRFFPVRYMY